MCVRQKLEQIASKQGLSAIQLLAKELSSEDCQYLTQLVKEREAKQGPPRQIFRKYTRKTVTSNLDDLIDYNGIAVHPILDLIQVTREVLVPVTEVEKSPQQTFTKSIATGGCFESETEDEEEEQKQQNTIQKVAKRLDLSSNKNSELSKVRDRISIPEDNSDDENHDESHDESHDDSDDDSDNEYEEEEEEDEACIDEKDASSSSDIEFEDVKYVKEPQDKRMCYQYKPVVDPQTLETKFMWVREEFRETPNNKIYHRLIAGLRPLASQKDLTDAQLVREFRVYDYQYDSEGDEKCICGKQGIKEIYFIENTSVADPTARTLYHKGQVGSTCMNQFTKCRESQKDVSFIMDSFHRKGITLKFYKVTSTGNLFFNVPRSRSSFNNIVLNAKWGLEYSMPFKKSMQHVKQLYVEMLPDKSILSKLRPGDKVKVWAKTIMVQSKLERQQQKNNMRKKGKAEAKIEFQFKITKVEMK